MTAWQKTAPPQTKPGSSAPVQCPTPKKNKRTEPRVEQSESFKTGYVECCGKFSIIARWWFQNFQMFVFFIPKIWGRFPIWPKYFFRWVGSTTNQMVSSAIPFSWLAGSRWCSSSIGGICYFPGRVDAIWDIYIEIYIYIWCYEKNWSWNRFSLKPSRVQKICILDGRLLLLAPRTDQVKEEAGKFFAAGDCCLFQLYTCQKINTVKIQYVPTDSNP